MPDGGTESKAPPNLKIIPTVVNPAVYEAIESSDDPEAEPVSSGADGHKPLSADDIGQEGDRSSEKRSSADGKNRSSAADQADENVEKGPVAAMREPENDYLVPGILQRRRGTLLDSAIAPFRPLDTSGRRVDESEYEPDELITATATVEDAHVLAGFLVDRGFRLLRRRSLENLAIVMSTFAVPADSTVEDSVAFVRTNAPQILAEPNHRYHLLGRESRDYATRTIGWTGAIAACVTTPVIGMIDTAIDLNHPALNGADIRVSTPIPGGIDHAESDHGTAIASLLVGQVDDSGYGSGLLPNALLRAQDVFRRSGPDGAETTAEWIVIALDQLIGDEVQVINLSLGGPPNGLLEYAVQTASARNIGVIAAAGNGGPRAQPVFPASYDDVLAVTAIDARLKVYRRASRGAYIDLSAPGVEIRVSLPGGSTYASGTSYATPFVTAVWVAYQGGVPAGSVRQRMIATAKDLGEPGHDSVFGYGLVRVGVQCAATGPQSVD